MAGREMYHSCYDFKMDKVLVQGKQGRVETAFPPSSINAM